jgi:ribosomal protein S18 acetylase RimI-like enzyme
LAEKRISPVKKNLPNRRRTHMNAAGDTAIPNGMEFVEGSGDLLDAIGPLWNKQARYHATVSRYFAREFRRTAFAGRIKELLMKAGKKKIRVIIARTPGGRSVGYAVGTISRTGVAEIDSLFVLRQYRKRGIGGRLVAMAVGWFDRHHPVATTVNVAVGNEPALSYYRRFGFFPRVTTLVKRD